MLRLSVQEKPGLLLDGVVGSQVLQVQAPSSFTQSTVAVPEQGDAVGNIGKIVVLARRVSRQALPCGLQSAANVGELMCLRRVPMPVCRGQTKLHDRLLQDPLLGLSNRSDRPSLQSDLFQRVHVIDGVFGTQFLCLFADLELGDVLGECDNCDDELAGEVVRDADDLTL